MKLPLETLLQSIGQAVQQAQTGMEIGAEQLYWQTWQQSDDSAGDLPAYLPAAGDPHGARTGTPGFWNCRSRPCTIISPWHWIRYRSGYGLCRRQGNRVWNWSWNPPPRRTLPVN